MVTILLKEFTIYAIHWLEHNNRFLWQTHKWHHSTEQMWWLPAQKTSFFGMLTKKSAYLWFILLAIPLRIVVVLGVISLVNAFFVHANLKPQKWMKGVELVFVTPRFHTIHHIDNPEVHGKNLGTMFTFFDRLFGTYVDPDTIDHSQKQFGLDGEPVTVKMIVGI
ncbi:MAG: sterol desaturase family protein [Brasilonema sp.]